VQTQISFLSYTTIWTRDGVYCGPVVDDVVLRASCGLKLEMQMKVLIYLYILGFILQIRSTGDDITDFC
jgi:hypothetical protein